MLTTLTRRPTSALVLATALALCGGNAQAQSAQQPSTTDDKGCQANTSGANGKANDADLDGTYSACSLVNGFIGFGARTNDGTNQAQEFGTGESDQVLRNPQFGKQDHRMANLLAQQGDDSAGAGSRTGRSGGQYRFGARDFVAGQEQPPIDDAGGYRGAARTYADAGSAYAPLLFSSSSETGAPDGQADVGGGGSAGGIDSGGNTIGGGGAVVPPITPAVPEPETWAMLLAGLGLLAFAGRRKAARTA
ncbi:PEP-CTERM sorting domain-containing protein [Janthinobacterium sp. HLX7-2]|uniref:PEP-CTERM sorting domain-containing protein n=1 Tax=Janthinobacterium sp. HLX7-2 TaxID=1259331 RepID=UPI003F1F488C